MDYFKSSQVFAAACQERKELNEASKWELSDSLKQEVASTASAVLSQFSVYSTEVDVKLMSSPS